ncbi:RnfABCDGE type electron transport complex subunit G [Clostridium tarantellae]|uniref:Ion-translocating oxidoreductase complex subunit G n=1 Tax=Clostridium tarantellae TaxID=39493 RepID=A0A6I1MVG4_9CLOT|nr:RnfABCDGE type electron transport complex subunit G [Clostridium tarantellae]MPQ44179.1 RnfABCDGE type electron transport complex subunit G [Clostridium tarantellae]
MKENLKLGFKLFIITAVAGLFLGIANELTKDIIVENSKLKKEDLKYILPEAESIKDYGYVATEDSIVKEVFEAIGTDEIKGYVIKVAPKGFNGSLDMVVGIEKNGAVGGIKILSQSETPGLGAKIEEENFQDKFKGLSTKDGIRIVKTIPNNNNEIQCITGATISSNAVNTGVNEAINFYKKNILGKE